MIEHIATIIASIPFIAAIFSGGCSSCGESHDRDVNAARNILALALSAERPVEEYRRAA